MTGDRLLDIRPPPCEKYGCAWKEDCASKKLACGALLKYMSNGSNDLLPLTHQHIRTGVITDRSHCEPNAHLYERIFNQND
jgi:hypothetical protein